ncbi:hypothetical protein [Pleurocapsa sp. PCC 7319]|uniref:hypothetical protein n=1 Tax=Pleurocapsa sp. PCC 7319 TaxID=118161 RepID=UPI00034DDC7E|nr:hypothetical protein [Pleurocapsa sp. PCC 7319]
MIKAWLVSVAILFVLAELSIWLKQFMLPLPIYILAGAFLAIASNYEKGLWTMFRREDSLNSDILTQTATLIKSTQALESNNHQVSILPESQNEQQSNG